MRNNTRVANIYNDNPTDEASVWERRHLRSSGFELFAVVFCWKKLTLKARYGTKHWIFVVVYLELKLVKHGVNILHFVFKNMKSHIENNHRNETGRRWKKNNT